MFTAVTEFATPLTSTENAEVAAAFAFSASLYVSVTSVPVLFSVADEKVGFTKSTVELLLVIVVSENGAESLPRVS